MRRWILSAALALIMVFTLITPLLATGSASVPQATDAPPSAIYQGVSTAVKFDVSPPLRDIVPLVAQDQKPREIPELATGLEGPLGPQDADAALQTQVGDGRIPGPIVSFNGPPNISSVSPPDPNGDVGPNHYVAMSNLSFQIFNKTGTSLYGPALNNTLWSGFGGPCQTENSGDPVVLYNQLDDRWMLSQFTSAGPTYYNCVAISTTPDPTGSYYRYAFSTGSNFPDYPKYGWWSDALYISTREFAGGSTFAGVGAYAINRAQLIAGNPAPTVISFLATTASAGGAYNIGDGLLPVDLDGFTLPPAGTPAFFMGAMDNGASYGAPADALTLWKFTANFATPASSSFVLANTIPISAYDTIPVFCGGGRACVPQPGTTNKIDHLGYRQRPLHRLAYRNFGSYQSLVTNQSVEASTTMSGIRWWEIRSPNSSPVLYQDSTYAPGLTDGIHRWMGSIAMDVSGNMALGYSASDGTSVYPSVRYTGRLVSDPINTMPQGEGVIIAGTGSQTGSNRWGDYTAMAVDPVDDCTFWYVNEWVPTTSSVGWQLRIGSFRFAACGTTDFTMDVTPNTQQVCQGAVATYTVATTAIGGFDGAVTLSATGNPGTALFTPNPVTPPNSSTLTITGAPVGSYNFTVTGTSVLTPTLTHSENVGLDVVAGAPTAPTLVSPTNGALNVAATPTFTWNAVSGASTYSIQVATDPGFTNIVASATGIAGTSWTSNVTLSTSTVYYWRVWAVNACGVGAYSAVWSFTTVAAPGDCGPGTTANVLFTDGFEAGFGTWTHGGTGDTWAIATTNPHSGAQHAHANDPAAVSDQRLASPAIALPSGQNPVVIKFWHVPNMENITAGGCYDGGILEVSSDAGATWTQVPPANILVGGYTGIISSNFSNPLAGLQAWCNGATYTNVVADVSSYAGQTVQFRFRLGSDASVSDAGWDVDDVSVQSCQAPTAVQLSGVEASASQSPAPVAGAPLGVLAAGLSALAAGYVARRRKA